MKITTGNYQATLYNIQGQKMLYSQFGNDTSFYTSTLSKGMYILKIEDKDNGKLFTKKLIKR